MFRSLAGAMFAVFTSMLIASSASAGPLVISDIVGGWQNANPAANATITNVAGQATDIVRWGQTGNANTDSGYDFNPTDNPVAYTLGSPFALGLFTHHNKPIPAGTSITNIDYSFGFDTNGTPSSLADIFNFLHNETPNGCSPLPTCADDIVTVSSVNLNSLVTVGTDTFFFNLLGFSNDGGTTINSVFSSPEGGNNSVTLYGILTNQPIGVPEPATLALLGLGFAGLGFSRRKKA